MAEIWSYDHTTQQLHRDAPPYTVPDATLIVNCLILLTHNRKAEDGSHFLFVPSSSSGFPDPWVERAVPLKRGCSPAFFLNALDVHRGSGIPKASPIGVTHPCLMAFFAIELTQGPNLRFPNLHVTHSIKRPQLRAPGGQVAKTVTCQGAVRCRGKVVAKCYGCEWVVLCAAHKHGLEICVPRRHRGHPRDGRLPDFGRASSRHGGRGHPGEGEGGRPDRGRPLKLSRAEKVQGNTQCALDQALNLASKRGEELEMVRGALKEAEEGRQKAEVEAAVDGLRVEVEALRRRGDDLQQRLGVAEAQVRSLISTLSATRTAQQGLGPPGVQSQGSGSRSGSQSQVDLLKG